MSQADDSQIFAQLEQDSVGHMIHNNQHSIGCSTTDFCESSFDLGDRMCPSEANNSILLNEKSMSFINMKESTMDESKCIDPKLLLHAFKGDDVPCSSSSAAADTPVSAAWRAPKHRGPPLPPTKKQKTAFTRLSLVNKSSLFSENVAALHGSLSPPSSSCYPNEKENSLEMTRHAQMSVQVIQKPMEAQRRRTPLASVSQNVSTHLRPIQSATGKKGTVFVTQDAETPMTDMESCTMMPYLPRSIPEAYHFAPMDMVPAYTQSDRHLLDMSTFSSIYVDFSLTRDGLLTEKRFIADDLVRMNQAKTPSNSCYNAEVIKSKKKRSEEDLYNPQWVRGKGKDREGKCEHCTEEIWLNLKKSAYWYHMNFVHGINSRTCQPYKLPTEYRKIDMSELDCALSHIQGKCDDCQEWVTIADSEDRHGLGMKVLNYVAWYKHGQKCHKEAQS